MERGALKLGPIIIGAIIIAAGALIGYYALAPGSRSDAELTPVIYSHLARVDFTGALPAIVAEEKGFWEEEGLDVSLVWFRGGGEQMRAVAAGEIEISTSTPNMITTLVSRGEGVRVISSISSPVPRSWGIMVLNDSPLEDVDDLRGKIIGATTKGAYSDMIVRLLLQEAGIDPDDEVNLTYLGSPDALAAALSSGTVDAAIGWPGLAEVMELELGARQLVSAADFLLEWEDEIWFATDDLIDQNPEVIEKVLRGWYKAVEWMKENRAEVIEISMEQYQWSEELATKVYDSNITFLSDDGSFSVKALDLASAKTFELELSEFRVPVEDLFIESFVPVQLNEIGVVLQ